MKRIQILLIEDNKILQDGISALLKKQSDMNVVSIIFNEKDILELISKLNTDIVLLDRGLPNQNNLNIIKSIKKDCPRPKIIVMDINQSQTDIFEYVEAGVSGFMLEDISSKEFLKTIRSVYQGDNILPPYLTDALFSQIIKHEVDESGLSSFNKIVRLTKREKQVMKLISDGDSNKEIAQKLQISTSTAKSHVHNILEKLSLSTRVQIAKHALSSDSQKQK